MLIPKKSLKARRRQLGVSDGVLDRLVAQIALDRACIDAIIRQLVPAAMPQHVRVDLHIEASSFTGSFNHRLEATPGEWCSSLTGEYERRLRLLFTL